MSKEKIILSFAATLLGLSVAGGAFYIYQMTKTIEQPTEKKSPTLVRKPSPIPQNSNFLILDKPADEEVVSSRTITLSGKTTPGSVIIISSETSDQVIKPNNNGNFTVTDTIGEGTNIIHVTAIFPNGEEQSVTKIITFSTEDF